MGNMGNTRLKRKRDGRRRDPITGEFYNRQHLLSTGKPKVAFDTQEAAMVAARELLERNSYPMNRLRIDTYECEVCSKWHVGNKYGNFKLPEEHVLFNLSLEIGERAAGCMGSENLRTPTVRFDRLRMRFEAAQRKRWQHHPTPRKVRVLP